MILVRRETNPDDLPGMIASRGILTSRGGKTSHAAVVARGMGRACVCGADSIEVDEESRSFSVAGTTVHEGEIISIDGATGEIYLGELPVTASPVVAHLEGADAPADDRLVRGRRSAAPPRGQAFGAWVSTPTPTTPRIAARARHLGAEGIGLCRTEHMFLGDRRVLVERVILATTDAERQRALDELLPLQRADFEAMLSTMDGMPVTIRLLDPPLHEFLPALDEVTARVARAEALGRDPGPDELLLESVRRMHEQNPMLGLRGVRLGLAVPGLYADAGSSDRRGDGGPNPRRRATSSGDHGAACRRG